MKISSRFTVAVHILILSYSPYNGVKTSLWMSNSINTNPALVRKIMGLLKKHAMIEVIRGTGGVKPLRDPASITLLDVLRASKSLDEGGLFHIHGQPNPECAVGAGIQAVLTHHLMEGQKAMEAVLQRVTIADLMKEMFKD